MRKFSSVSEIEEEKSSEVFEISTGIGMASIGEEDVDQDSLFTHDHFQNGGDVVYVAVGKSESSMDALVWTINHAVNPSTLVFLIHVFPEIRHIPTPLGKLPVSQVNPEQKESYMKQERSKRRDFLQKFLDKCSASQVKVDTILIESDLEAKAILDLIPILNITKLIVGTTKSNLRKMRSRRGSEIADQIVQNAPEFCEVKLVCEGKEVVDLNLITDSSSPLAPATPKPITDKDQSNDSFTCACFKPKVIS
ncbi:hypothetical protein F0562_013489 [Nyssa sinensis]|uniref:UspA domain-containing protein n=1 Tax=Nyssa sinensis TaxID=561372 RepID=A0A5J4ZKD4_9ASTE|nr:hypothetical protein F0562_013489 [Nyssa sinensis]